MTRTTFTLAMPSRARCSRRRAEGQGQRTSTRWRFWRRPRPRQGPCGGAQAEDSLPLLWPRGALVQRVPLEPCGTIVFDPFRLSLDLWQAGLGYLLLLGLIRRGSCTPGTLL